ncbi:hypothetical protein F2P81_000271 [Scophthalmus maximus]|uniref:Uncharacterized protein n=1 Tax=Scophthalmus maximus TaxID=52904 RepID=A0A6A4TQJ4_SCOMX|nr:hypothetical protein F2P81_000271 [Scophthalmus maximus]
MQGHKFLSRANNAAACCSRLQLNEMEIGWEAPVIARHWQVDDSSHPGPQGLAGENKTARLDGSVLSPLNSRAQRRFSLKGFPKGAYRLKRIFEPNFMFPWPPNFILPKREVAESKQQQFSSNFLSLEEDVKN